MTTYLDSAVIQPVAMHETGFLLAKPSMLVGPQGQGASNLGLFRVDQLLCCPDRHGHVPEGTGMLTCLAACRH